MPEAAANDGPMVRQTAAGSLEGVDDSAGSGTWWWKGVPFAQPPVGPLRWRAPQAPEPWTGVRPADRFGHACLQIGRLYGPGANNRFDATIGSTLNTPVGSEDCLTLNIWRPATQAQAQALPVLFFIHGGSNISGYTADPVYDGARLARASNAVVVTANYRLGVLGFLNLPALHTGDADEDSGNFALLDLIAALRWVQANIAAFGGDAHNVTAMGQSAGAINLLALIASPRAQGLFHKAMPLSGGISLASNLPVGSLPTLLPAAAYLAQGRALLLHLLVADGHAPDLEAAERYAAGQPDAWIADYLRAQDARTVLSTVLAKGLTGSGPIPDGTVLPADPIAAIGAGHYARVPMLTGITRDEGKLFAPFLTLFGGRPGMRIDDATRFTLMQDFDPDAPATLRADDILDPSYLPVTQPGTGYDAMTDRITQGFMAASRDNLLDTLKTQQSALWHYRFDWAQEPAPWNAVYGAAHAFDLPFLFGNFGPSVFANATNSRANQAGRLALSAAMMAGIAAFLRTGDPNDAALGAAWAPWPARIVFDATPDAARITAE